MTIPRCVTPCKFAIFCTMASMMLTMAIAVHPAEMTTRQVTAALFKASADEPLNLSGKDLSSLDLSGLDFKGANLTGANLFGVDLSNASLVRTQLSDVRLDRATITSANFSGSDLSRATILSPNVFTTVRANVVSTMGIDVRELPNFENVKMIDAIISGRLDYISFRRSDLSGTQFGHRIHNKKRFTTARIEMIGCDFTEAKLIKADLSRNNLQYAKFINADLRGANFKDANLTGAYFSGADVAEADFSNAEIDGAHFIDVKGLDRAKGLRPIDFEAHH